MLGEWDCNEQYCQDTIRSFFLHAFIFSLIELIYSDLLSLLFFHYICDRRVLRMFRRNVGAVPFYRF